MNAHITTRMQALSLMQMTILTLVQGGDRLNFNHTGEPVSYAVAKSYCFALSAGLIDNSMNDLTLKQYMKRNGLKSVWLGLRRETLKHWTWTEGEKLSSAMPGGNHGCGGVSTVAGSLRAMACNYGGDHEGVVCESDYRCPAEKCFKEGGQWFSFKCGVSNWYKARDVCNDLNSTIAKLNTTKKINALVNAKTKDSSLILCGFFWIGVSREEWHTGQSGGKSVVARTRWDNGEPVVGKDCAIASLVKDKIIWSAVDCKHQYKAVCMEYTTPSSPVSGNIGSTLATNGFDITHNKMQTTKRSDVNTEPTVPLWLPLVIAATGITVTAMGAGCIIYFIWRRKKNKSTSQGNDVETSQPLADMAISPALSPPTAQATSVNQEKDQETSKSVAEIAVSPALSPPTAQTTPINQGNDGKNSKPVAEIAESPALSPPTTQATPAKKSEEETERTWTKREEYSELRGNIGHMRKQIEVARQYRDPGHGDESVSLLASEKEEDTVPSRAKSPSTDKSAPEDLDTGPALADPSFAPPHQEEGYKNDDKPLAALEGDGCTPSLTKTSAPEGLDTDPALADTSSAPIHKEEGETSMASSSGRKIPREETEKIEQEFGNRTLNWKEGISDLHEIMANQGGSITINVILKQGIDYLLSPCSIICLKRNSKQKCDTVQEKPTCETSALFEISFDQKVKLVTLSKLLSHKCDILVMYIDDYKANSVLNDNPVLSKDVCVLIPAKRLGYEKCEHAIYVDSVGSKTNADVFIDDRDEMLKYISPFNQRSNECDDVTWCAALLVALLLMKARAEGFQVDEVQILKKTANMRNILQEMADISDEKEAGPRSKLSPEKIITDWESVKRIMLKYIGTEHHGV